MSPLPLTITYPPELPVSQARDELARAIAANQVTIVAGATGSGKTTQLPKICLELGRERIGHTQPRRIAARSVAERIASELKVDLGSIVGYQVRFDDRSSTETAVKVMTDGVLLAELSRDRDLKRYDTIIIDEAHERSLTIDFLLGYLNQLLPRRPELKVIITSATIDPERFAKHFADADGTPAPIIEVSGRSYPVEIRYRPLVGDAAPTDDPDDEPDAQERDLTTGIVDALTELQRETPGDVLVFLSGESEIRDAEDVVRGRFGADTEVVPLYGRLSAADQHRVFDTKRAPGIRRRIVLATNVAETSLTVPGIRYVVDAGTARISRYSSRAKVQRLPIEAISQASANQRAGRAGRTADGIAIRLYSEEDFERRPAFTDPEILRTSLAGVILRMLELGLGDIATFPFVEPPDSRGVKDGYELLSELGAVREDDASGGLRITRTGRTMSRLPVDPRFARMLVEAGRHGVVREVAVIVAGLSVQDTRERPLEKRPQADAAHARFTDPTSDFLSLVNLWNYLEEKQRELSGNAFRRLLKAEYLNYLRVREWQDLVRQILRAGKDAGLSAAAPQVAPDTIHKALLSGLLSRIGLRDDRDSRGLSSSKSTGQKSKPARDFIGSRNQKFAIFPGSALAKKPPAAVMAAELVETSRLFARTVAAIDPAWAEALAGDLAKKSYSLPRWEQRQGSAVTDERVTLFGVPIVAKRRVQLGRIDPEQARELFIRHALVAGEWQSPPRGSLYAFDRENERLRRELGEVEERERRRDILADDEQVFAFYDARLPATVTDTRAFERWWKDAQAATPELLTMSRADLLDDDRGLDADAYPSEWRQGDAQLRLAYRFEPGADDDGVTVEVPLALLPRLSPQGFDWLVPGLREDLATALIRTLPKQLRREVVPAADWARRLLPELPAYSDAPLVDALADAIRAATHAVVRGTDFEPERLPAHLRMGFAVIDQRGKRLGHARSLAELQQRFAERARETVADAVSRGAATSRSSHTANMAAAMPGTELERTGLTAWPGGDLPQRVEARHGQSLVVGYPALVDEGSTVAVRILGTAGEQAAAHARGVRRLLALTLPSPASYVQQHLSPTEKLALATSPYPSTRALIDDAVLALVDSVCDDLGPEAGAPFTAAGFETLRDAVSARHVDGTFQLVALAASVLTAARVADRAISAASSIALMSPLADARTQLDALVHPGFIRITGATQLRRVPVYLAGITHRVERLAADPGRDRRWQNEVDEASKVYTDAGGVLPLTGRGDSTLHPVRWMLEELRISLFAQHLGTPAPVSPQRIRKALT